MTISQGKLNKRTLIAGRMAVQMAKRCVMREKEQIDGKSLLSWVLSFLEADESERASQAVAQLLDFDGSFVISLEWKYGDLDKNFVTFKPQVTLVIIGRGLHFYFDVAVNSPLSVVAFSEIKDEIKKAPWNLDEIEPEN